MKSKISSSIKDKLLSGSSSEKTVSPETKAKVSGMKKSLAPESLGTSQFSAESVMILGQIYDLMVKMREQELKQRELDNNLKEEVAEEEELKNEKLAEAIRGPKKKKEKPKKKPKKGTGVLSGIIGAVPGAAVLGMAVSDKNKEEQATRKEAAPPPAPTPTPAPEPVVKEGPHPQIKEPTRVEAQKQVQPSPTAKVEKREAAAESKPVKVSSEQGKNAMVKAMDDAKITDATERAAIMAQVSHESGGFSTLSENLNYKAPTLLKLFPKKFASAEDAQQVAAGGPQSVAERIYGGRMGNAPEGSGDGFKYRGRGFIQLTGKQNYTRFGLAANPNMVSNIKQAADTAIKYMAGFKGSWDDIKSVTKFVNGGYIGLEDRQKQYQAFLNDPSVTKAGNASATQESTSKSTPTPSTPASSQVASVSKTNDTLKDDLKNTKTPAVVNNSTVTNTQMGNKAVAQKDEKIDDRPIYLRKLLG